MTSQETSRQSRLVTSAPVSLWRMGRPDSPPFVAPQGQSCASSRVSSITPSTLWWAWSTTPMSGGSHAAASLYLISGYLSQSRPCFGVAICNIFNSTDFFFSSDWSSTCFCLSTYLVRVDFPPPRHFACCQFQQNHLHRHTDFMCPLFISCHLCVFPVWSP